MNIERFDLLTLDDNKKYIVASIIDYRNTKYYFLCEEKDPRASMFCYLENNKLIRVEDKKLEDILKLKITKELFS